MSTNRQLCQSNLQQHSSSAAEPTHRRPPCVHRPAAPAPSGRLQQASHQNGQHPVLESRIAGSQSVQRPGPTSGQRLATPRPRGCVPKLPPAAPPANSKEGHPANAGCGTPQSAPHQNGQHSVLSPQSQVRAGALSQLHSPDKSSPTSKSNKSPKTYRSWGVPGRGGLARPSSPAKASASAPSPVKPDSRPCHSASKDPGGMTDRSGPLTFLGRKPPTVAGRSRRWQKNSGRTAVGTSSPSPGPAPLL